MKDINFEYNFELIVRVADSYPTPRKDVREALETLLNDNLEGWILEAIGHPAARNASIEVI